MSEGTATVSELQRLMDTISDKRLTFNRFSSEWSPESKLNWESFNLGIDIALEMLGRFISQCEVAASTSEGGEQ